MGLDAIEGWEICAICGRMGSDLIEIKGDLEYVHRRCYNNNYIQCSECGDHIRRESVRIRRESTDSHAVVESVLCSQCSRRRVLGSISNESFNKYILPIIEGTGMTIEQVVSLMEEKKLEFENFISNEGALFLIASIFDITIPSNDGEISNQQLFSLYSQRLQVERENGNITEIIRRLGKD